MDRRSILFVISLSLTLFATNLFFNNQEVERRRKWQEYQEKLAEKRREELHQEVAERAATLTDLPLAPYQLEKEGADAGSALVLKGNLILLSGEKELPTTLYSGAEAYTLATEPTSSPTLALYRKEGAGKLPFTQLERHQNMTLQLLLFPDSQTLEQSLATVVGGEISFPYPFSSSDGFAFMEVASGQYLPVGLVSGQEKTLVPLNQLPGFSPFVSLEKIALEASTEHNQEDFFVLENAYQQLVFSTKGGALVEINLPFKSETHPHSVVRSIEFDRDIEANHAYNAHFPHNAYYTAPESLGDQPTLREETQLSGYYPLLRRDYRQDAKGTEFRLDPHFYGLNVVSEYPEVAELSYTVKRFEKGLIEFEAVQPHRRITKTFTLEEGSEGAPYVLNLSINVEGDSRGLWLTTGIPEVEIISNAPAPSLKYRMTRKGQAEVQQIDLPKETLSTTSINPDWISNSNGFFGIILDPISEVGSGYRVDKVSGNTAPSRLLEVDKDYQRFKAQNLPGYQGRIPLASSGGSMDFRIYAGPFATSTLKAVDAALTDLETGSRPDYQSCQTSHGYFSFISRPIGKFLFLLMNLFHSFTGSWVASILGLTLVLKLLTYPLMNWSMKSMRRMQQIKPLTEALQEKYKKDPERLKTETFNLYREHRVNPFSGCFGPLLQIPLFAGMYEVLKSTFELRGAPFITGWIDNLAAPDVLLTWDFSLPIVGTELHILPLLTGALMFLQAKMGSTLPKNKEEWTDQQKQQAMMAPMMGIIFSFMFYNMPAGLNLYWGASSLLGIIQQWIVNATTEPLAPLSPSPKKGGKKNKKAIRAS